MFFTLKELLRWLGVTVFEIFVAFVCFLVFTVLLTLKLVDGGPLEETSWWWVYSPLFVSDAVNTYFCVIIFIRMQVEVKKRLENLRCNIRI